MSFFKRLLAAFSKPKAQVAPTPVSKKRSRFKLSSRSIKKMIGVKDPMQRVVKRAIKISDVDFSVGEGVRTKARQRRLVKKGASQTMNSKHITGDAVDLFAHVKGEVSWDVERHYIHIATAMAKAAKIEGVAVKWGAAWSEGNIAHQAHDPQAGKNMMNRYAALRKSQGRKAFIDAVHFELI